MKTILSFIVLFIAFAASNAQNNTQVPEQWAWTQQLTGNWKGDATLTLGDQNFNVVYHANFKQTLDGNVMTMSEWFTHPDLGSFKGENLIGYSPTDNSVHWFSVDNFGTAHEHTGTWADAAHFTMVHSSVQDGQPFAETIELVLRDGNQKMDLRLTAVLGGVVVQAIEGTFLRSNRP